MYKLLYYFPYEQLWTYCCPTLCDLYTYYISLNFWVSLYDYYLLFCKHNLQTLQIPWKMARLTLLGGQWWTLHLSMEGWSFTGSRNSVGPESLIAVMSATGRPCYQGSPGAHSAAGSARAAALLGQLLLRSSYCLSLLRTCLLPLLKTNAVCQEQLYSHLCTTTSIFLIKKFIKVSSIKRKSQ